jgi:hypothetical protein
VTDTCPRRCKRLRGRARDACCEGTLGRAPPKLKIKNKADADAETFAEAREGVTKWVASLDALEAAPKGSSVRGIRARYRFALTDVRKGSCERIYSFDVEPVGAYSAKKVALYPGQDPSRWQTKLLFRKPKDAIKEIESVQKSDLAYRGMNWSEWREARKRGYIQSRGGYNLPGQEVLTFFSPDVSSARRYASSFAPIQHKAAKRRPAVVVAVPKKLLLTSKDRPDAIPESELATDKPIPLRKVSDAWMLVPTEAGIGHMDLIHELCGRTSPWRTGSGSHPSIFTALVKMPKSARRR